MAEPSRSAALRTHGVAIVVTTLADAPAAESLVRALVEERLIACGNVLPGVASLYRWQGEVSRDEEVLVVMKAAARSVDRLFTRVAELHPYDVPELIELPVQAVAEAYCRWVIESTEVSA